MDNLARYEDHISDKTSVSRSRPSGKLNIQENRYFSWRKSRSCIDPSQVDYDSSPEKIEADFMCKSKISNFVKNEPVMCPEDNSIIPTIESHEESEIASIPSLHCLSPNRKNF